MSLAKKGAESKATEILKRFDVTEPPVPAENIARALGAQITYEAFEGEISGMLLRDEDTLVIGVNSRHAPTRQRFTVAHEIGHILIHEGRPIFIDRFVRVNFRDGESGIEEIEANAFAAELLMPHKLIYAAADRALLKHPEYTPEELARLLARQFEVSTAAMQYRLINLEVLNAYSLAD